MRLQDARHSAIRVLIVHKESQLGIHKVNDEIDRRCVALDEFDGHGIPARTASARCSIAGDRDGTGGDEIEDGHAALELEDVGCASQVQAGDCHLADEVFFILNGKSSAVLETQAAPIDCVGSRDVAAGEWSARLGRESAIGDVDCAIVVRGLFLNNALRGRI